MIIRKILATLFLFGAIAMNGQDKKINASELPKDAGAFLQRHFTDNIIHNAAKSTDDGKVVYEVMLKDGTEVEFTENGSWHEVDGKGQPIATSFIAQPILDYIGANYSQEMITHIEKSGNEIDIDLSNGLELEFDANGKFRRIDK